MFTSATKCHACTASSIPWLLQYLCQDACNSQYSYNENLSWCLQMLARPVHKGIAQESRQMAEALLGQMAPLLEACPLHQPLACMKAKQVDHCLTHH